MPMRSTGDFPDGFAPGNSVIVINAHEAAASAPTGGHIRQTDTSVVRFINEVVAWLNGDDAPKTSNRFQSILSPATLH
jgi:hypothetical protein